MEQSSADAAMSEQGTDRVYQYTSELSAPVMHVMAGFRQKDVYHVPRMEIEPPNEWGGISESCRMLAKGDENVSAKAIGSEKDGNGNGGQ